ncbi:cell envelope integrity protein TolA [Oceanihabitans sediminis]|uniref:cell envelope integrity protein TolA n=1 Tax=Oceanihabitans sediminis TaxID=1812012 RepID=UPI00299E3A46|nr:cell envelope integrity protein TolA [Oceanihabitans sediminis]MDX1279016.1 cell envelope integrity protein TolA [Oceanihabitans sediminis]
MKKVLLGLFAVFLVFGLVGCTPKLTVEEAEAQMLKALEEQKAEHEADLQAAKEHTDELLAEKEVELDNLKTSMKAESDAEIEKLKQEIAELKEVGEKIEEQLQGYELERVLGEDFEVVVKENRLDSLFKGEIEFDDEDIDVEEVLSISDDLKTLVSGFDNDEFGETIYLGTDSKGAIEYKLVFKDEIDLESISDENSLKIKLLGTEMEIVEASEEEIKMILSEDVTATVGTVFGDLTVENIGENAVLVKVGDEIEVISEDSMEEVGDYEVMVDTIFYDEDKENRLAVLKIGTQLTETVQDGDAAELFGQDEDEPLWVWSIDMPNSIGLSLDKKLVDLDEEYKPLKVGDSLSLPGDYASVMFLKLTDVSYMNIDVYFDEKDLTGDEYENVVIFKADDEVFNLGDEDVDTVYVGYSGLYYKDGSYKRVNQDFFVVSYDETEMMVERSPRGFYFGEYEVRINRELNEFRDLVYDGVSLEKFDEMFVDYYGMKMDNIEDSLEDDKLVFQVPSEEVMATVLIK